MREPLPGWEPRRPSGSLIVTGDITLIADSDGEWWIDSEMEDAFGHSPNGMVATMLAAEDAARAMVADMAKALGGSVTWATEGGE